MRGSSTNIAYSGFDGRPGYGRVAQLRGVVGCGRCWEFSDQSRSWVEGPLPLYIVDRENPHEQWNEFPTFSYLFFVFVRISTQLLTTRRRFGHLGPARLARVLIVPPFSVSITMIRLSFFQFLFDCCFIFIFSSRSICGPPTWFSHCRSSLFFVLIFVIGIWVSRVYALTGHPYRADVAHFNTTPSVVTRAFDLSFGLRAPVGDAVRFR